MPLLEVDLEEGDLIKYTDGECFTVVRCSNCRASCISETLLFTDDLTTAKHDTLADFVGKYLAGDVNNIQINGQKIEGRKLIWKL